MTRSASDSDPSKTTQAEFRPSISVIIPIYNGEADLPDLVPCLWEQTYPADRVEYLLVDNNSGDRTADLIKTLAQDSAERGVQMKILQENTIQSSYAARNRGIKAAQGEILVFTDADCRPCPNWLTELVKPFSNSTVGLVAGEITGLPSQNLLEAFAARQDTLSQKHTLAHAFCPYGQTANLAVRRSALALSGLFRPYLTTGGDADLCWRILRYTDWRIVFAEKALVQHRHRSTLRELRRQWQRYGRSNRYLHELHGVELNPDLSPREYMYRTLRWLLKEIPAQSVNLIQKQSDWANLLSTPLSLVCIQARSWGQRQARLPPRAREIEDWS